MESKVSVKLVRKEGKNKKPYFSLVLDFGYREQILEPYDTAKIISILDCPMSTLYDLCSENGSECIVAYLDFKID